MAIKQVASRIRDIRKGKHLTLQQVAERCEPRTTAQTVGRLETGARALSLHWLNRIARALGVAIEDLLDDPVQGELQIAALLDAGGVRAPDRDMPVTPPRGGADLVVVGVRASAGDYRVGDEIWCRRIAPDELAQAMNRDVLIPRPAGRYLFGRLIGREEGLLHILPLAAGQRQMVVADPAWIAVASRLIRPL